LDITLYIGLIIVILISVNALYVAAEFAAVSVRRSRIRQLADEGNVYARQLLPTLEDATRLDRYVAASQIGITLSSLVLGAFGQATLPQKIAPLFVDWSSMQTVAAQSTSAVIVLVGLTVLQVVLGELVPKSVALQYPTRLALYTAMPMRWSLSLFSWLIIVLNGSGELILKWLHIPYNRHRHIHSPEELALLLADSRDGGLLEEYEYDRLNEALLLSKRTAGELMVPRLYVTAIEIDTPLDDVVNQVGGGPYTRVPVYRESIDNIIGIIHAKDLMIQYFSPGGLKTLSEVIRPAIFVPEFFTVDRLLTILREEGSYQAIVIDEFGGMEGLVTLEDVLADLLGEIGDELKDAQAGPEKLPDGRVRLPGLLHLDEIEQWAGVTWQGESATVGGYVAEVLGRIPTVGEQVTIDGVGVVVERMENYAIVSVLITPLRASEED